MSGGAVRICAITIFTGSGALISVRTRRTEHFKLIRVIVFLIGIRPFVLEYELVIYEIREGFGTSALAVVILVAAVTTNVLDCAAIVALIHFVFVRGFNVIPPAVFIVVDMNDGVTDFAVFFFDITTAGEIVIQGNGEPYGVVSVVVIPSVLAAFCAIVIYVIAVIAALAFHLIRIRIIVS